MNESMKILFVEDEEALGMVVSDSLRSRGFEVDYHTDGESALQAALKNRYDVLVLDVMLPKMDGFSLAREFRKNNSSTPIIFLTARSQTEDVVEGFELGGNDYLKKPFSMEELIVRVKSLTGRALNKETSELEECFVGKYKFNIQKQTLELDGKTKSLTHRESQVLFMLFEKRNQVLERKQVLDQLWGDDSFFNGRSMDVFITRLRKYLRDDPNIQIVNIRGIGYKLML
ncbi:response regulator transcription factor [Marinifilum caeruleilacunae]|uniref:Response regulator transcription factor n=1 Tax=Marinifilum caeruleilacunae TaxID=2499076 RepID=A0ABX1WQV8_9BACT|nr:response regulator transcription factor [Marinifilum caeruleilacunae]NOU58443.1 response regulator transcription factor [Marinifilum caeruleilacunae]